LPKPDVPELEELPLEEPLPLLEPPEGGLVGRLKPELPELPELPGSGGR